MSLDRLQTEAHNPASANLDELTPLEIVRLMNREDGRAVEAVASQAEVIAQAIELIATQLAARRPARLRRGRHIGAARHARCDGMSADVQRPSRTGARHHRRRSRRADPGRRRR